MFLTVDFFVYGALLFGEHFPHLRGSINTTFNKFVILIKVDFVCVCMLFTWNFYVNKYFFFFSFVNTHFAFSIKICSILLLGEAL